VAKKKKQIIVCLVLDETGSMECVRDQTISGYNEYIASLKKQGDTSFTLVKFDSTKVETVHDAVPIKDVPELSRDTYIPGQMTPLYDAIGQTIKTIDAQKGKPNVIFAVLTDGYENASREYSQKQISDMITERQDKKGWTFAFLGANQDAWAVSQGLGMARGNTMTYAQAKTPQTFVALAAATAYSVDKGATYTSTLFSDAGVTEEEVQ